MPPHTNRAAISAATSVIRSGRPFPAGEMVDPRKREGRPCKGAFDAGGWSGISVCLLPQMPKPHRLQSLERRLTAHMISFLRRNWQKLT
jgi:hypothetical protein